MFLGMIGLGRMGGNMAERLTRGGHQVAGYNKDPVAASRIKEIGLQMASSLEDLVRILPAPRTVWVMVPAGKPTQDTVDQLGDLLSSGDLIVDGGNTRFTDDIARAEALKPKGIHYMDAGTSGGVWGLEEGYCLMTGGAPEDFARIEPALKTLAPENGYLHCGPVGAGHFVKMVHNGIEYGVMAAYAEGLNILHNAGIGKQE
ncbi:MAG TPA: NADP-dependent phosphogluconate dehydrogenase, partial [Bryobacteraceae bacterium]|nr:NADP-dependent phosphogluconate dehydrogenase [Bryobacteraceae bacterium]